MRDYKNIQKKQTRPASSVRSNQSPARKPAFQLPDKRPQSLENTTIAQTFLADNRPQSSVQRKQGVPPTSDQPVSATLQKKENKTGLPDDLKSGIENLSGISMDDVNVHYHSDKPAQLNAHAYAQGTDIHIASGQEKHLPHEAWHVVQQKQNRVKPTLQMKGKVNINDDKSLEKEADTMGAVALKNSKPLSFSTSDHVIAKKQVVTQLKLTVGNITIENEYSLSLGELKAYKQEIDQQGPVAERDSDYRRLLDIIRVREERITDIDNVRESLNYRVDGSLHQHLTNLKRIAAQFAGATTEAKVSASIQPPAPMQAGVTPIASVAGRSSSPRLPRRDHSPLRVPAAAAASASADKKTQHNNPLNLTHDVRELENVDIPSLVKILQEWQVYVKDMTLKYRALMSESRRNKRQPGYYADNSVSGPRADHKKISQLYTDFSGAENEIRAILMKLEAGGMGYFYLVAKKDGIVQGLLEKLDKDANYISNIIVNPDNIEPRPGKNQVKGTLKDLLKTCVRMNLEGKKREMKLYALSGRVKKIYDHYGFRVKEKKKLIERPNVDRHTPGGWRTPVGQQQTEDLKKQKHAWFENSNMKMTVAKQEKFLKDEYTK